MLALAASIEPGEGVTADQRRALSWGATVDVLARLLVVIDTSIGEALVIVIADLADALERGACRRGLIFAAIGHSRITGQRVNPTSIADGRALGTEAVEADPRRAD